MKIPGEVFFAEFILAPYGLWFKTSQSSSVPLEQIIFGMFKKCVLDRLHDVSDVEGRRWKGPNTFMLKNVDISNIIFL